MFKKAKNVFRKIVSYGVASFMIVGGPLSSCTGDSESEYDKLKKEYEAMQKDSINMVKAIKYETDVKLEECNVANAFWYRALGNSGGTIYQPANFADSVRGIGSHDLVFPGYALGAQLLINQYGPDGYNQLNTDQINGLNNTISLSNTYVSFLTPIANKRLEMLAARGK